VRRFSRYEYRRDPGTTHVRGGETRDKNGSEAEESLLPRGKHHASVACYSNVAHGPLPKSLRRTVSKTCCFPFVAFTKSPAPINQSTIVSLFVQASTVKPYTRPPLHWPAHRFAYVGVDPPADGIQSSRQRRGELGGRRLKPFGVGSMQVSFGRLASSAQKQPFSRIPPTSYPVQI
jgi:hypothetical protein